MMFLLGAVCWTGCARGWEGEEDDEDDILRGLVWGAFLVETWLLAGVLELLRPILVVRWFVSWKRGRVGGIKKDYQTVKCQ